MFSVIKYRLVHLLLVTTLLGGCSFANNSKTLNQALDQGLVDVEFTNVGTFGDVMIATVHGKATDSVELTIPSGLIVKNERSDEDFVLVRYQGMLSATDAIDPQLEEPLTAHNDQASYGLIEAYSIEAYTNSPTISDTFRLDGFAEADLKTLIDLLAQKPHDQFTAKQIAIWAITDDADREVVYWASSLFKEADFEQAKAFLIEAKFDPTNYLMFQE
ncbi:hypothetical protein ACP8Y2_20460 [Herpetosiphon llansteffanensis]